jgi:hypothetical protein
VSGSEINNDDDEIVVEVHHGEIKGVMQKELSSSSPNVFKTTRK